VEREICYSGLRLGSGCLCLVLHIVIFSKNEMGRERQVVVGPFKKDDCLVLNPSTVSWVVMMVWC
jgi:hypothetical protein